MRVDWCVSSWFRIKNTHSLTPFILCFKTLRLFLTFQESILRTYMFCMRRGRWSAVSSFIKVAPVLRSAPRVTSKLQEVRAVSVRDEGGQSHDAQTHGEEVMGDGPAHSHPRAGDAAPPAFDNSAESATPAFGSAFTGTLGPSPSSTRPAQRSVSGEAAGRGRGG